MYFQHNAPKDLLCNQPISQADMYLWFLDELNIFQLITHYTIGKHLIESVIVLYLLLGLMDGWIANKWPRKLHSLDGRVALGQKFASWWQCEQMME